MLRARCLYKALVGPPSMLHNQLRSRVPTTCNRRSAVGEFENVLPPVGYLARFNSRLSQMVEYKNLIRMEINKLNGLRQMPFKNQNVVGEPEWFQRPDPAIEVIPQHVKVIRFIL